MSILFKGYNRLTTATTSNPATIAKNLVALSHGIVVCTIHYAAHGDERSGGAPTWNGNAMIEVEDYHELANSPGAANEMWYCINTNATGGAGSTFSVPNTGNDEIFLSLLAYDADGTVSMVDSYQNAGLTTDGTVECSPTGLNGELYVCTGIFGESGSINSFTGIQRYKDAVDSGNYEIFGFDDIMTSPEIPVINVSETIGCFVTHVVAFSENGTQVAPDVPVLITADGIDVSDEPSLNFYATDDNYDDVTFQILIDNNSNFLSPEVNSLSASDSGFDNISDAGDTDPFTSGYEIQFTVQPGDALSAGTHYWKVRAKDPNGSNTWSAYSAHRSFEVVAGEIEPTIVLDTVDEKVFTIDRPRLDFTGSDGNNDDLTYEIEIHSEDDFTGKFDEYADSNHDTTWSIHSAANYAHGQSFQGINAKCSGVSFMLNRVGSPTGNVEARLYAHTGTFGTSSKGTGSVLASATVAASTIPFKGLELFEFTFDTPYQMSSGTNYVVVVYYSGGDGSNRIEVGHDSSSPTHNGNMVLITSGSAWSSASTRDVIFEIYNEVLIEAASNVDDGFAIVSGKPDTDPFRAGSQIGYTVEAGDALDDGTYFWRARTKDPSGSDTWSSWATSREFDIDTKTNEWGGVEIGKLTEISGIPVTNLSEISGNSNTT